MPDKVPTPTAGEGVRLARQAAGLSIRELAAAAGISPSTLGRLERSDRPYDATMRHVARAFGDELGRRWQGSGDQMTQIRIRIREDNLSRVSQADDLFEVVPSE